MKKIILPALLVAGWGFFPALALAADNADPRLQAAEARFQAMDADGDGRVSWDEFHALNPNITRPGFDTLAGSDGVLSKGEWSDFASTHGMGMPMGSRQTQLPPQHPDVPVVTPPQVQKPTAPGAPVVTPPQATTPGMPTSAPSSGSPETLSPGSREAGLPVRSPNVPVVTPGKPTPEVPVVTPAPGKPAVRSDVPILTPVTPKPVDPPITTPVEPKPPLLEK